MQFFTEECTSVYFNKSINSLCTYIVIYTYIYIRIKLYITEGERNRDISLVHIICVARDMLV